MPIALFLALAVLTYAYLYPGSAALFDGRTDTVMSDDTDPATLPFLYDGIISTFHKHPSYLLYGAVYVDNYDPEFGMAQWLPWNERWVVVLLSPFVPIEQISTAFVFIVLMLNAMTMYALARYLLWNRSIASGLAIAWAFCVFTRARAKTHMAMSGTYHLPLIFLGLFLVVRGRSWRSTGFASAAFLLSATVAHYFVTTSLFLSPLFLLFFALQPEMRENWRTLSKRLVVALLPAMAFLAFNFACPVPKEARLSREKSLPAGGENVGGQTHPFLTVYAAHPIDYFSGDISLQQSAKDPNPLRESINNHVLENIGNGNTHERSNGIRWAILILAAAALVGLARGKFKSDSPTQRNLIFFTIFAGITFWLSMGPDFPFAGAGLSYWLHELVSQIRVPSRAGIGVHFALLMMTGFLLASNIRWRKWLQYPGVFPALMIMGYPPLVQDMPMAPMRPKIQSLQRDQGACGAGLYFPFMNQYVVNVPFYQYIQRMRGSDCAVLNTMLNKSRVSFLLQKFPPSIEYLNALPGESATVQNLERLARCVPLTWIVFDAAVPKGWREQTCHQLGWTMYPDLSCVAPNKGAPLQRFPDECG